MYYLKLTFFLIVWLIILINQIQRIDMRIEMRERRIVENKQGIYTIAAGLENSVAEHQIKDEYTIENINK